MRSYLKNEEADTSTSAGILELIVNSPDFLKAVGPGLPVLFAIAEGSRNYSAIARRLGCGRRRVRGLVEKLRLDGFLDGSFVGADRRGVYRNGTGCTKKVQGVYRNGTGKEPDLGGHSVLHTLSLRDSVPGAHALQSSGQEPSLDPDTILGSWSTTFQTIHDPRSTPSCAAVFKDFSPADIACGYDALVTEFKTNWNSKKKPNLGTLRTFIEAEVSRRERKARQGRESAARPERAIFSAGQVGRQDQRSEDLGYFRRIGESLKAERLNSELRRRSK